MCGIVGIWGDMPDRREHVLRACARLHHRGPDSRGDWTDLQARLSLGHVRLAILDTSPAGHQPMVSACERYVIVLNGEIYNHLSLRQQLENQGHDGRWRGHSDTETVLAAFSAWGAAETVRRLEGMFAIALWDRQERTLTLMRDRMGEKPLYYGYAGTAFVFASQPVALQALPGFDPTPDPRALSLLMRHNYIPAPYSIYRNLRKLPPGTLITLHAPTMGAVPLWPEPEHYGSLSPVGDNTSVPLAFHSDEAATDALEACLTRAVESQMLADVPLGAFLSGGIDSSTIVALMRRHTDRVQTFAIGFEDPAFNEADHARAVARHLGTEHTEHIVTERDALNVIPDLPGIYDEPFADASQIPTTLVAQLARRHVTVALSGDGGDELFAGYSRYLRAQAWWKRKAALPSSLLPVLGAVAGLGHRILPCGVRSEQLARLSTRMRASNPEAFYLSFVSYWHDPAQILCRPEVPRTLFDRPSGHIPEGRPGGADTEALSLIDTISRLDTLTYLPDDILVKVDRAAMAASLETRVPLLDRHVVEFSRCLPMQYKLRGGQGKWLLRQVLHRHVPNHLIDRPKKGFSVPLGNWLRGPLRDWAQALLDPVRLRDQGLFRHQAVQRVWQAHLAGRADFSAHLWGILMVQSWLDHTASTAMAGHDSAKESA